MVDILDNVSIVSMVDSNDTVYMLEKMNKKGLNWTEVAPFGQDWSQLASIRLDWHWLTLIEPNCLWFGQIGQVAPNWPHLLFLCSLCRSLLINLNPSEEEKMSCHIFSYIKLSFCKRYFWTAPPFKVNIGWSILWDDHFLQASLSEISSQSNKKCTIPHYLHVEIFPSNAASQWGYTETEWSSIHVWYSFNSHLYMISMVSRDICSREVASCQVGL